jgi:hypothetical protein
VIVGSKANCYLLILFRSLFSVRPNSRCTGTPMGGPYQPGTWVVGCPFSQVSMAKTSAQTQIDSSWLRLGLARRSPSSSYPVPSLSFIPSEADDWMNLAVYPGKLANSQFKLIQLNWKVTYPSCGTDDCVSLCVAGELHAICVARDFFLPSA